MLAPGQVQGAAGAGIAYGDALGITMPFVGVGELTKEMQVGLYWVTDAAFTQYNATLKEVVGPVDTLQAVYGAFVAEVDRGDRLSHCARRLLNRLRMINACLLLLSRCACSRVSV